VMERFEGKMEEVRSKLTHLKLGRDDVFVALSGGGGGVGDPLLREPELVAKDVSGGYITPAHATNVYGVVLEGEDGFDAAATEAKRVEIRKARIGGDPGKPLSEPPNIGISLAHDNGAWSCTSCQEELASGGGNWREGAVLKETLIVDRYAEMEMKVRGRTEGAKVVTREHFCPSCAMSLGVDVATEDLETLAAPDVRSAAAVAGA
jgi:N-methylhydantoinase B